MLPSTLQYAAAPLASACHCGALRVTAETGSPMALAGIPEPNFTVVQSASVMVLIAGADGALLLVPVPAPLPACWLYMTKTEARTIATEISLALVRYRFMRTTPL
jgi:hypothetical protein